MPSKDIFEPSFPAICDNSSGLTDFTDGEEVQLLTDCVWFVNSMSRHLLVQKESLLPHIALHILIRYSTANGMRESLVARDRFMVAAACFQIASKLTSQHCKHEALIEFLHLARPANLALRSFEESKPELGHLLSQTELEIFTCLKFEPYQILLGQPSPLPVEHARSAIKRLSKHFCNEKKETLEYESGPANRKLPLQQMVLRLSLYAEKMVFDSYCRPLVVVVPPQIIAAACVLNANRLIMKSRVCPRFAQTTGMNPKTTCADVCTEYLKFKQASMLPDCWLKFFFKEAERKDSELDPDDVSKLAERMLKDSFAGYSIHEE